MVTFYETIEDECVGRNEKCLYLARALLCKIKKPFPRKTAHKAKIRYIKCSLYVHTVLCKILQRLRNCYVNHFRLYRISCVINNDELINGLKDYQVYGCQQVASLVRLFDMNSVTLYARQNL